MDRKRETIIFIIALAMIICFGLDHKMHENVLAEKQKTIDSLILIQNDPGRSR